MEQHVIGQLRDLIAFLHHHAEVFALLLRRLRHTHIERFRIGTHRCDRRFNIMRERGDHGFIILDRSLFAFA